MTQFLGWITKADSKMACKVIDGLSKARKRRDRSRPLALHVSMRVEGETSVHDGEVYRDIDSATIRIADPITADPI